MQKKAFFYTLIPLVAYIACFLDSYDVIINRYTNKLSEYRVKKLYIIWVAVVVGITEYSIS
jgi:hypothetical protein